ncbi:MAG: ABC transporter permease [Muribaculaceae bacterium]|nr:ABC transporter permease [Muribaculaceae bacterium]
MVWNLLKKNISAPQITGYAVANLIGLAIVLTAVKFYTDIHSTWTAGDSFVSTDYLVVSKPVPLIATGAANSATTFSDAEIEDLRAQPWAQQVGVFTGSDYNVSAHLELGGRHMSTALFFESIPDEFYDITPAGWDWTPDTCNLPVVPIVMSKDYLALYNYGFAPARGMPQISENIIGRVPLTVALAGNGHYDRYPAKIVGFSSRLNTIAVPQTFMEWANERYRDSLTPHEPPGRLIIKVNSPGDPAITEYFEENGIEVGGDKAGSGRAVYLMSVVTAVVVVVGIIITVLAVFILMLSIFLLMQKNREKLRDLMLLGYSPHQICVYYYRLVGFVNLAILVGALLFMFIASSLWQKPLRALDIAGSSPLWAILSGVLIISLITALNFFTIRRLVRRYF